MLLITISILIAMHHMLVGKILYSETSVCNIMFQFKSRASLYQENHMIETKWLSCDHSISVHITIPCNKIKADLFILEYFTPISGFFKDV